MTVHVGTTGPIIRANNCEPEVMRQMLASENQSIPGVVGDGDLVVAQNGTPNMGVQVASGFAVINGTNNSPVQGYYQAYNDAALSLTIAASDPTNPRNDLVVMTIRDAYYSGANNDCILQVITGTPAGTPSDPAVPASSITLARVRVDANVTSIVNAKITDLRQYCGATIFPRGVLGYAQVTANQNGIGAAKTDLTSLTVTVTVGAGRRIRISGYAIALQNTSAALLLMYIQEGATQLEEGGLTTSIGSYVTLAPVTVITPSAGTHTYKLQMNTSAGTTDLQATANVPAWILVEDLGHK